MDGGGLTTLVRREGITSHGVWGRRPVICRAACDPRLLLTSAEVCCYAFWTPPQRRGMLPHRDGSHVIAIQLEGRKLWRIYGGHDESKSDAGLEADAGDPTHEFVLAPGDLFYLPHGWTRKDSSTDSTCTSARAAPRTG